MGFSENVSSSYVTPRAKEQKAKAAPNALVMSWPICLSCDYSFTEHRLWEYGD